MAKNFAPPLFLDPALIMQILGRSRSSGYRLVRHIAEETGKEIRFITISDVVKVTKASQQEIIDRIKGIMGVADETVNALTVQQPLRKAS